jgi:site-specific recombinase XerD
MSTYRPKGSPFYHFDFWVQRNRFHGSTGCRTKREADKVEDDEKRLARARVAEFAQHKDGPLSIDAAAGRYWLEAGQHRRNAADLKRDIKRLVEYFGPHTLLQDIGDNEVAKLVAWRRGHRLRKDGPMIAPATVNRSTTQVLQRIFIRARKVWRVALDNEPHWRQHLLEEPQERVRELRADEAAALADALDPDYEVIRQFSVASGMRMKETLLRWTQVDFAGATVITVGKGGRPVRLPMTTMMRRLLMSRKGHHPEFVFTYQAKRASARKGSERSRGKRYPITVSGLKTHWRRRRAEAGVADYRWHDNRHTFATELLRTTGNLKLVQRGLNHSKIETTAKYAHVLDDELRAGMEAADRDRDTKSRKISRTANGKVA